MKKEINRNKCITLLSIIACFFYSSESYSESKLVQVIVDHSGVLHDERDSVEKTGFDEFTSAFFKTLATKYRRDRSDTIIHVISAIDSPRTVLSNTASDFSRKGIKSKKIEEIFDNKIGCNDIPTAIEHSLIEKKQKKADINILHIITSGVHSGKKCESTLNQEKYVKLIESLDSTVTNKLKEVSSEFDVISIQFLTATQRRLFFNELKGFSLSENLGTQGEDPSL